MIKRTLQFALLASTALGISTTANGQDLGHVPAVDTVVVTTAGMGRTVGDILSHVDVVIPYELGQTSGGLGDRLEKLPGISSTAYAPGTSRPIIRGLDGYRVQVLSNNLGLLDAASISPDHAPTAEAMTADRIEIFRGPAALAFGGSAIGGVVNVIDHTIPTQQPDEPVLFRLSTAASSVNEGFGFTGEGLMKAGNSAIHLGFSTRTAGDYQGGEDTPVDNSGLTANVVSLGGSQFWNGGWAGVSVQQFETDYGIPGDEVSIDMEQTRLRAAGGVDVNWGIFENLNASVVHSDYTHTEFEGTETGTVFDVDGIEGRVELMSRDMNGHRTLTGIQYADRDVTAVGDEAFLPETNAKDAGLFLTHSFDSATWGFETGARLDWAERETATQSADFTDVSAAAGAYIKPNTDTKLGLVLSRTVRAPAEAELFADGPHVGTGVYEIGDATLDNEIAWNAEASINWQNDHLRFDGHLFYADFENYIDLVATGGTQDGLPEFMYTQAEAEFWGFEAHIDATVMERDMWAWHVDLTADYVRATSDTDDIGRIPPLSVALGTTMFLRDWENRLEVRWFDDQDKTATGETATDGYTLVNASAIYAPDHLPFSVMIGVDNITDELARPHTSFRKADAPLAGRNVKVRLTKPF